MRVYLRTIILYNFKSFRGKVIVGPFMPFTAIIGPNGAGKSNIMDAISFVVGEKNSALRVRRLNDLIFQNSDGTPAFQSAHVTAIFEIEGKSKEFTRCIRNSCNEYKIDNQIVAFEFYMSELASLGLNVKTKSFLVFQGAIESISSPNEICRMFDELSKSAELKSKYERLKNEMNDININLHYIVQKKRYILAQKKHMLLQLEEAKTYNLLQTEYNNKKTELQLFRLFHIREDLNRLKVLYNDAKSKINKNEDDKKNVEILLRHKKNKYVELTDHKTMIEDQLREMEQQFAHENEQLINVKEKVSHLQQKIPLLHASLTEARLVNEVHKKTIQDLQNELTKINQLKTNLTQSISSQLESQGSNIELDNAQVQEYYLLKGRVQRECAEYIKRLNHLKHKQENDQNKLDNEIRKKQEMEDKKRELQFKIDQTKKQIERLEQYITTTEVTLTEKQKLKHTLETEIMQNKNIVEETQKELDRIREELSDFKASKFEISKENKKSNTINILKSLFPEVYGRLFTMCKPIHEKYNIAVTKLFWKHKDAVVVKTVKVAKQCIEYLKEQQISVETFLPLDSLKVQPISKKLLHNLRDMENPKHVQHLYNVINFYPEEISNAILFVIKNTLVCETSEDARQVAYETQWNNKYSCIALDGSYYQKSGIISGGSYELSTKASMWQNKQIEELELQKMALVEKLKEASTYVRKQSELTTVNSEISGLTSRLKYSHADIENINKQMISFKSNSESIDQQLILTSHNIETAQKAMDERYKKIEHIENQINRIEDIIFTTFCRGIDVINIREYEKSGLRIHEERRKREAELENQYDCIKNMLDLEINRNTEDKVIQYETDIQFAEEQLRIALLEESAIASDIEKQKNGLDNLKHIYANIEIELDKIKNEVAQCRRQISIISKLILETQRECTVIKMKAKQKINEKYSILQTSEMEGITIPTLGSNTSPTLVPSLNTMGSQQSDDGISLIIDFSYLPHELQTNNDEQFRNIRNHLIEDVKELENKLKLIPAPNLKAEEKMTLIHDELNQVNKSLKEMRNTARIAIAKFTRVKEERIGRFLKCFDYLKSCIDNVYKKLLNDMSAQALLMPYNPEEPYLDGIDYSCILPGKQFNFLSSLSGGEQVLAILTLLFAMHGYEAAPFIALDEIDAPLDRINIKNIIRFIQSNVNLMNFIIISLNNELFTNADGLIGVTSRKVEGVVESSIFTLSLEPYGPGSQ